MRPSRVISYAPQMLWDLILNLGQSSAVLSQGIKFALHPDKWPAPAMLPPPCCHPSTLSVHLISGISPGICLLLNLEESLYECKATIRSLKSHFGKIVCNFNSCVKYNTLGLFLCQITKIIYWFNVSVLPFWLGTSQYFQICSLLWGFKGTVAFNICHKNVCAITFQPCVWNRSILTI